MQNEYEVPVWFRISATTTDDAFWKVRQIMAEMELYDQLPEYVVEEPVPLLTGEAGWVPFIPEEEC